ncbi:cellulose binding domain-containing protein [Streptomyces sp. Q6]|uniref:Cellulose binding domain-containing protein n=1 Tax=Streptomyces citrinus TaxID=3118173 RepID=A0ACD5AQB4_9ACTN
MRFTQAQDQRRQEAPSADITVRNTSDRRLDGWKLDFAFPGQQKINSVWNAKATQNGSDVHVTPESWTNPIPAGGSVSFGLNGSSTGGNGTPTSFSLDGRSCAVA